MSKTAIGQRLITEQTEANVIVQQKNFASAKINALKDAKDQVILQAISRFIDFDSMIALEPLLKIHFLEKQDIFIESIRVISEKSSNDLSEFNIKIKTQIFRSRILATLRNLGVTILGEKIPDREVLLIYSSNSSLINKKVSLMFLKNLKYRLKPYRIKLKVVDIKDKDLPIEEGFSSRLKILQNKESKKVNFNSGLLELKLNLSTKKPKLKKGILEAQFLFWHQNQSSDESPYNIKAKINISLSDWNEDKLKTELLNQLMIRWTPIIRKIIELQKGTGKLIKLKFNGIKSPLEEQLLFKTFFQNNPLWEEIVLDKITVNSVSYNAIFLGNDKNVLKNFVVSKNLPFKILNKLRKNNQIAIDTKWREVYANLERYKNSFTENKLIEKYSLIDKQNEPILQVPLKTFKSTYILPFESPVFDHIRHRGDSTLFKIDWPKSIEINEKKVLIKIFWSQIGPSNLNPKITLFDQNKKRIKSYLPGKKKQIKFEYQLTKEKGTFFIRIADQLGFLDDVAGSYQSFRYVLSIKYY